MNKLPSFKKATTLTKEEEEKYLLRASKGDKIARDYLIENNQFLVLKICNLYRNTSNISIGIEDLLQEGNIGLILAVDKFKLDKKVRLATYASYWIHQRIKRYIADKSRLVHIPGSVQYKFYKVLEKMKKNPNSRISKKDLKCLEGIEPDIDENSELSHTPTSLKNLNKIEGMKIWNEDLEKNIKALDIENFLDRAYNVTEYQKRIIILRLGLDGHSRGFKEIGNIVGTSYKSASWHYFKGISNLRTLLKKNKKFYRILFCN